MSWSLKGPTASNIVIHTTCTLQRNETRLLLYLLPINDCFTQHSRHSSSQALDFHFHLETAVHPAKARREYLLHHSVRVRRAPPPDRRVHALEVVGHHQPRRRRLRETLQLRFSFRFWFSCLCSCSCLCSRFGGSCLSWVCLP